MTPFAIGILMHYATTLGDHPVVFDNPPIWDSTRKWFLENDLLVDGRPQTAWKATERCKAYVDFLCAVPLPVAQWVLPAPVTDSGTPSP